MKPRTLATIMGAAVVAAVLVLYGQSKTQDGAGAVAEGAPMVVVTLPTLTGPAVMGAAAYEGLCSSCHGVNGAGRNGFGPPLIHKIYEPNHHGDMAFLMAAQNGVQSHHWPFGDMPPVAGATRADIEAIVAFIRQVQAANGI